MAHSQAGSVLSGDLHGVRGISSILGKLTTSFMQRRAADVGQYLAGLLNSGSKTGSSIFNLPLDLLLDELFLYLFVEDILSLRRVSRIPSTC